MDLTIILTIFSFSPSGLPADKMGLKVGDEIEKVNEKSVRYSTHAQIVTTIHEVINRVFIIFIFPVFHYLIITSILIL